MQGRKGRSFNHNDHAKKHREFQVVLEELAEALRFYKRKEPRQEMGFCIAVSVGNPGQVLVCLICISGLVT